MTKPKKPRKDAHIVYEAGVGCVCAHCGAAQEIKFPCTVKMFAAITEQFIREHINCKPKAEVSA